jgi:hypothetical protein
MLCTTEDPSEEIWKLNGRTINCGLANFRQSTAALGAGSRSGGGREGISVHARQSTIPHLHVPAYVRVSSPSLQETPPCMRPPARAALRPPTLRARPTEALSAPAGRHAPRRSLRARPPALQRWTRLRGRNVRRGGWMWRTLQREGSRRCRGRNTPDIRGRLPARCVQYKRTFCELAPRRPTDPFRVYYIARIIVSYRVCGSW